MIISWISLFLVIAPVQKPCFFIDETTTADWVCDVFANTPPAGGVVNLVCHLQPQYVYTYSVWLVNAIVNVDSGDNVPEFHCIVVYYESRTGESGLAYDKVISRNVVKLILDQAI